MSEALALWGRAFAITLAFEVPLVAFALVRWARPPGRWRAWAPLAAALPSAMTHPLLWFVWWPLWLDVAACWEVVGEGPQWGITAACGVARWAGGEALVVGVEAALLRAFGLRWAAALGVSLVANAISAGLGGWMVGGG